MTPLPAPDNRLYVGRGGSGKTTLALSHAADFKRVIFYDPNALPAAERWASEVIDSPRELVNLGKLKAPWRIAWRGMAAHGLDEAFDLANRLAWATGDVTVIWDEADVFFPTGRMSGNRPARMLVNMGRNRGIRVFATARRPVNVPRDYTANLSRAVIFNVIEPDDVQFLRGTIGREAAARLPSLPPFSAIDWTEAGVEEKNFYDPQKT